MNILDKFNELLPERHTYWYPFLFLPIEIRCLQSHLDEYILKKISKKVAEELKLGQELSIISIPDVFFGPSGDVECEASKLDNKSFFIGSCKNSIKKHKDLIDTNVGNLILEVLKNNNISDVLDSDEYEEMKMLDPENEIWKRSCLYFLNNFFSNLWYHFWDYAYEYNEYYLVIDENSISTYTKEAPEYDGPGEPDYD